MLWCLHTAHPQLKWTLRWNMTSFSDIFVWYQMFLFFWQHAESCCFCVREVYMKVCFFKLITWSWSDPQELQHNILERSYSWCLMVQLWHKILCKGTANNAGLDAVTTEMCYLKKCSQFQQNILRFWNIETGQRTISLSDLQTKSLIYNTVSPSSWLINHIYQKAIDPDKAGGQTMDRSTHNYVTK